MPDPSHYLYTLRPARLAMLAEGPTEAEAATVSAHFNYLKELSEQGTVVLAGRTLHTDETSFSIVILRANSEPAARTVLENDPAVKGGVMHTNLDPYRIALMAQGSP